MDTKIITSVIMNAMDFDPGTQLGRGIVAAIFQAISEIRSMKGKSDARKISRFRLLKPFFSYLEYFKLIHNLSNSYLLHVAQGLFGSPETYLVNMKSSPEAITSYWETHYSCGFERRIEDFKSRSEPILLSLKSVDIKKDVSYENLEDSIKQNISAINTFSQKAHNKIIQFINRIEERAKSVLEDEQIVGDPSSWRKPLDTPAKKALGASDDVLLNLIPVITHLYHKALNE